MEETDITTALSAAALAIKDENELVSLLNQKMRNNDVALLNPS